MLKLKAQILCGEEIAMGPGKAALLEAIAREGSITAAGKAIGMSYRRAWLLVDEMNRCWALPLVEAGAGGAGGGGAKLTANGRGILTKYRALQESIERAARIDEAGLISLLRPQPLASAR